MFYAMATKILAGTSGYGYKGWRGTFYPDDLAKDKWLSFYAGELPTVEINNTFYRMPKEHVVASWRDAVPDSFRFVIKASRRITHQSRLKNAEESTGYLIKRVRVFGAKLGAVLFQLPPYLQVDIDRLQTFQQLIPDDVPAAFEFRHESWDDPAVDVALQSRGHARVVTHGDDAPLKDVSASPLVYLRLRASNYSPVDLKNWYARVLASGAAEAFVFFKHEDDGVGPKMAKNFLTGAAEARTRRPPAKTNKRKPKAAAKAPAKSTSKTAARKVPSTAKRKASRAK